MSHPRTTHSLYFHVARIPALPLTLLPFLQQEYLQAALQDNGAQLPKAKSPVALTNVVSTEQETLCSHNRVKYLLFISAKAGGGATIEKVELIAKEGGGLKALQDFSMTTKLGDLGTIYSDTEKYKSNISK